MTPEAASRVAARRRRILNIRRAVAGAAVAVFLAAFSTIYVQMGEGHDPALAASPARTAVVTSATSDDSYEQDDQSVQSRPAPVITRQS